MPYTPPGPESVVYRQQFCPEGPAIPLGSTAGTRSAIHLPMEQIPKKDEDQSAFDRWISEHRHGRPDGEETGMVPLSGDRFEPDEATKEIELPK